MLKKTLIIAAFGMTALTAPVVGSAMAKPFVGQSISGASDAVVAVRYEPRTGRINARIRKQAHRIRRGRRDGSLTPREYRRLKWRLRQIRHARRAAVRNGRVTRWERRRILRKLNRNDRRIYRLRHNRRHF